MNKILLIIVIFFSHHVVGQINAPKYSNEFLNIEYSAIEVLDSVFVNGEFTLGENIELMDLLNNWLDKLESNPIPHVTVRERKA